MSKLLGFVKRSQNLSMYFISALIPMVVSLVLNPFISLNMEKEDFAITGYYASFNLLILPLVSLSLLQYYSKSYFHYDEKERQNILDTIQSTQIIFGLLSLLTILFIYFIYNNSQNLSIPFFPYAIFSFSTTYMGIFYVNYQTKLKFERKPNIYLKLSVSNASIHAILIIILVICFKLKADGYFLASLITMGILALYSLSRTLGKFQIDKHYLKEALRFCWPLVLANLMEYIYAGIDRSFLVKLNNNAELGLYNIAVTIGSYVTVFYTAISQTFQPDLFENVSKKDLNGTIRTIAKIQILNIIPILLFIILAPILIDILTFGRYADSTAYARIIALKGIFAAIYFSLSTVIIAGGQSKITLLNKTIGTIAVYFLISYLITNFGYIGAAWGQALSYIVMIIISFVFIVYKRKEIFI